MYNKRNSHLLKGWLAESSAILMLLCRGHTPLHRNMRTPIGEIDILSMHMNNLHIIEVKYRKTQSQAHFAISPNQKVRLIKQKEYLLSKYKKVNCVQLDVVTVTRKPPFIEYHKNVYALD